MHGNVHQIISSCRLVFSSYVLGGRRGLAPGLTTGALVCTLLQWCFNEFDIFRIRYVSETSVASAQQTKHGSVDASENSPAEPSTHTAMQPIPAETPVSRSLMDHILSMFGQRLSDEEHLERLKMERDSYLRRIAKLEEKK